MINIYKLFFLFNTTQQLIDLGFYASKYKVKGVALPGQILVQDGGDDNAEQKDYTEDDFRDLKTVKQIQQSIKVFYDRLSELINPIDEQRLNLDSVHNVKLTVKEFYKAKN